MNFRIPNHRRPNVRRFVGQCEDNKVAFQESDRTHDGSEPMTFRISNNHRRHAYHSLFSFPHRTVSPSFKKTPTDSWKRRRSSKCRSQAYFRSAVLWAIPIVPSIQLKQSLAKRTMSDEKEGKETSAGFMTIKNSNLVSRISSFSQLVPRITLPQKEGPGN